MRRVLRLGTTSLVAAFALAILAPAQASSGAECTAKQKRAAQSALAAYRKAMPAQRAAYFRTHRTTAQRTRYVKSQQVKLKALQAAAACRVASPQAPPPPPPPEPPYPY